MTRRFAILASLAALLTACGRKGPLKSPSEEDEDAEEGRDY
ncbi:MAG: LPS translocon maturation chaperone LptM [Alphaproteobacteria bacterium]|jgi:predicted small lipoprotein YifL